MNWEIIYKYRWQFSLLLVGIIFSSAGILIVKFQDRSSPAVEIVSGSESKSNNLVVEIAGAVNAPGVYEFEDNDRIIDALDRAGGISEEADRDWLEKYLNKAAVLQDGQKLYIPREGEQSLGVSANIQNRGQAPAEQDSNNKSQASNTVNINSASQQELESLWGIGPVTAQNIIEHRPYSSLEELLQKKILKSNVYERNIDKLSVY